MIFPVRRVRRRARLSKMSGPWWAYHDTGELVLNQSQSWSEHHYETTGSGRWPVSRNGKYDCSSSNHRTFAVSELEKIDLP